MVEVPLSGVRLVLAEESDAGSARVRLSPSELTALGCAFGDALLVRVWCEGGEEWRFLCCAACHAGAGAGAQPAALDATVQLPPRAASATLRRLRALASDGATLRAAARKLARPVGCDVAELVGSQPAALDLLRGRLLLPGALLHLGATALRVSRAEASSATAPDQPLRILPGTRLSLVLRAEAEEREAEREAVSAHPSDSPLVAGSSVALSALRELVSWPTLHAAAACALGVRWPRGVLLHGPPGCGKTLLVRAVCHQCGAALHVLGAGDVMGAFAGESERNLREAFAAAAASVAAGVPTVLFLDEVDALCPRRTRGAEHETRVTAQLLVLLDGAAAVAEPSPSGARLLVVGATNRPDALDPALRRPGRFDREIEVPLPDADARAAILELHARRLPRAPGLDLRQVAKESHGYSGADMAALAREAAMVSIEEAHANAALHLRPLSAADFAAARRRVGASVVRGCAVEAPAVEWSDIGGLEDVKQRLRQAVEWPLRHADAFARLALRAPRGVLLHGPPGCSKTTLARAAAHASGATLIPLSGASLFSMFLGEGERQLARAFARARAAAPSIILLDEADGVAGRRGEGAAQGGSGAEERLLCTLLSELDGLAPASGVLLIAATNRPDALDAALLRPGRLDLHLYVPPPDAEGRLQALRIHTRRTPLAQDVDLQQLAQLTRGCTGAELAALCAEAAQGALRESPDALQVAHRHFTDAAAAAPPGLTEEQLRVYAAFASPKGAGTADDLEGA